MARADLRGRDTFLLDADIDENGRLLAHALDLIRHFFTRGTHPIDIHEAFRLKFAGVPVGYSLEPRAPIPHVTVDVVPF